MKDSAFSLWPTAVANDDNKTPKAHLAMKTRMKGGPRNTITSLQVLAQQWPTPMAGTPAQNGNNAAGNNDFTRRAEDLTAANWPKATTGDHKGSSATSITRQDGKSGLDMLDFAAEQGFTLPDPLTWTPGGMSLPAILMARRLYRSATCRLSPATLRRLSKRATFRKRRLNPVFVEWLMGWPEGHALCGCSAMAFTRWQRHMRGALSALPTASGAWIWAPPAEMPKAEQMELFAAVLDVDE